MMNEDVKHTKGECTCGCDCGCETEKDHECHCENSNQEVEENQSKLQEEEELCCEAGLNAEENADGKKSFGKKKEKKEKKDKKDEKIEELTDQVKRQMAEFDNFRKRSEKEKCQMFEIGAKSIVEKILPVIDNFERGLAAITDDMKDHSFVEGMDKVYRQMMTELETVGVKPIEAVGCEFDPNFHNAVMHVEDEAAKENVVVEEFQKGYIYRDTVVRHSMVKVAN